VKKACLIFDGNRKVFIDVSSYSKNTIKWILCIFFSLPHIFKIYKNRTTINLKNTTFPITKLTIKVESTHSKLQVDGWISFVQEAPFYSTYVDVMYYIYVHSCQMFGTKLPYYREIIRFCVLRTRIDAFNPNSAALRYCDITMANIATLHVISYTYIYIWIFSYIDAVWNILL